MCYFDFRHHFRTLLYRIPALVTSRQPTSRPRAARGARFLCVYVKECNFAACGMCVALRAHPPRNSVCLYGVCTFGPSVACSVACPFSKLRLLSPKRRSSARRRRRSPERPGRATREARPLWGASLYRAARHRSRPGDAQRWLSFSVHKTDKREYG